MAPPEYPQSGSRGPRLPGSALWSAQAQPRAFPTRSSKTSLEDERLGTGGWAAVLDTVRLPALRTEQTLTISNRSGSSVSRALGKVPVPFRACAEHPVKTDSFSSQSGTSVRRPGRWTLVSSPRGCGEFAQRRLK